MASAVSVAILVEFTASGTSVVLSSALPVAATGAIGVADVVWSGASVDTANPITDVLELGRFPPPQAQQVSAAVKPEISAWSSMAPHPSSQPGPGPPVEAQSSNSWYTSQV